MNACLSLACGSILLVAFLVSGCSGNPAAKSAEQTTASARETPPASQQTGDAQQDSPGEHGQHGNRLAQETSPYLLLHAHNPVDWYPWGPEAMEKAKRENKIIFLSIGYSSCHWCHVMERESFMDEQIAEILNEHFVCIKVDREERPDVDSIYMTALQVYNRLSRSGRGGGWPLSMFLLPDGRPFFGGTYFPARDGDRGAATGFLTLVQRIQQIWSENQQGVTEDAAVITRFTKQELEARPPVAVDPIDAKILQAVRQALADQYDEQYGGFGFDPADPRRPKFPEPSNLFFLVDRVQKTKDEQALKLLTGTLERMALGGIRDHVGGGFHRYSVDRFWRIPHFEKMLYDNGQLASLYAEAYLLTGREDFKRVVDEMLNFVLREMTDQGGGFYSALDADSENEEGKFYRWEKQEVRQLLDDGEFQLFAEIYGLAGEPNFEEHYYAPQLDRPMAELAEERGQTQSELVAALQPIREKLFQARSRRERPLTDTKILTAWNGLMIRGFADAGRCLENDEYIRVAERAAEFSLQHLRTDDGRLLRTYSQGAAKLNAYLDDYAFLVDGLIALYRATSDQKWLDAADSLTTAQLELFWDETHGGFFFTSADHESLLARGRNPIDGARPSGNSVSAGNLLFLGEQLNKPAYREKAQRTIQSVSGLIKSAPAAVPRMAVAISAWLATASN